MLRSLFEVKCKIAITSLVSTSDILISIIMIAFFITNVNSHHCDFLQPRIRLSYPDMSWSSLLLSIDSSSNEHANRNRTSNRRESRKKITSAAEFRPQVRVPASPILDSWSEYTTISGLGAMYEHEVTLNHRAEVNRGIYPLRVINVHQQLESSRRSRDKSCYFYRFCCLKRGSFFYHDWSVGFFHGFLIDFFGLFIRTLFFGGVITTKWFRLYRKVWK
jgi:hypothetical protein